MKTAKTCLLIVSALCMLTIAKAQTADEIIAKHTDALGGKDKILQITSAYIESSTTVMGNDSPTKTYIINGKGYRNESDFNGQNLVQVVTDKGAWEINPFAGSPDAAPMPDAEFQGRAGEVYVIDPLVNYTADSGKAELAGQEKVGDVNTYKIKYTNKFNAESFFYIDPATWYIIKTTRLGNVMGQDVTIAITYSNYQKTDFGVFMPYTTNMDMGQFSLAITTKKVEINKTIDPAIFDMPK